MNEPATGAQQIASAHQKLKINMSLTEFEQFLDGSVAAPDGERPDDWIALLAPGADEDTRRSLSAALASRAADVKRQVRPRSRPVLLHCEMNWRARASPASSSPGPTSTRANTCPARPSGWPGSTGFTGSAGLAIVLKDKAAIFVDGRYTLQVREQVDAAAVRDPPPDRRAAGRLDRRATCKKGEVLGFDPWLHHARRRRSATARPRARPAPS